MAEEYKKEITGYPSIDKPWMRYYPEGLLDKNLPSVDCGINDFLRVCSQGRMNSTALDYLGNKITYKKMFDNIDRVASALHAADVGPGDAVSVCC